MNATLFGSVTRISDLEQNPFEVVRVSPDNWQSGDYVVGTVTGNESPLYRVETCDGSMQRATAGDRVVGALGDRAATLEGVGSFRDIVDGHMQAMTSAGLFGRMTSLSPTLPATMSLDYEGHVMRNSSQIRMRDFALRAKAATFTVPTVLLVGTSMSAGKTETGKLACRVLSEAGLRVIGAKLTGAGRYRDILSFRAAGAAEIYDFVDVGLPSTVVDEADFRGAIRPLLAHIQGRKPDVLVAEAGASPLEPYNGEAAIDELDGSVRCTILCASDPYAVVGVRQAFGLRPDLVTGPATNTTAAIALVRKLTGIRGINILDPDATEAFRRFILEMLGVPA